MWKKHGISIKNGDYANSINHLLADDVSLTIKIEKEANKILMIILVVIIAIIGLLFGIIVGKILIRNKKGDKQDDI